MRRGVGAVSAAAVGLMVTAGCASGGEPEMEEVAARSNQTQADQPGQREKSERPKRDEGTRGSDSSSAPSHHPSQAPSPSGTSPHQRESSGPADQRTSSETPAAQEDTKKDTGGEEESQRNDRKPEALEPGSQGARVRQLQRTLRQLHYDPGEVDGVFGVTTEYAVFAFQKVNGLTPDGVVGPKTRQALRDPRTPEPLQPSGAADRVGIDLGEQLLYVYENDKLRLISHISSGSEDHYCTPDGHCGDAVTPTGDFEAAWRVDGWRKSDLGRLYNPVYFAAGGFAVHGSGSVPTYPASHGCVRIPMHTAEIFPDLVEDGQAFYVRD